MPGYCQDGFDLDAQEPLDEDTRRYRCKAGLVTGAYMIPLVGLWIWTDYPDGLGGHIDGFQWWTGKLVGYYYYSYLLLERHRLLDLVTFIYMWAPVAAGTVWLARNWRKPDPRYGEADLKPSPNSEAE